MSHSRRATIFAAIFLGIFAFVGAGCQRKAQVEKVDVDKVQDPALRSEETALLQNPALKSNLALPITLNAINENQDKPGFVQSAKVFLGDINANAGTAPSSPLKVRGGAMTVFAKNKNGWEGDGTPHIPGVRH